MKTEIIGHASLINFQGWLRNNNCVLIRAKPIPDERFAMMYIEVKPMTAKAKA